MSDEKESKHESTIKEGGRRLQAEAYRPARFYTEFTEAGGTEI